MNNIFNINESETLHLNAQELNNLILNKNVNWSAIYRKKVVLEGLDFFLLDKDLVKVYGNNQSCLLTPLQLSVYDCIMGAKAIRAYFYYDICQSIFLKYWPSEFEKLMVKPR